MTDSQQLPAQGEEWYDALVGSWEYSGRVWVDGPTGNPVEDAGTAAISRVAGGRALQLAMRGTQFGAPFEGVGLFTYDTRRAKYASVWTDNTTGAFFQCEGHVAVTGDAMRLFGRADGPGHNDFDRWWRLDVCRLSGGTFAHRYFDLTDTPEGTLVVETVFRRAR